MGIVYSSCPFGQAPAEVIPNDDADGSRTEITRVPTGSTVPGTTRIAPGQKLQGPHAMPREGEAEHPPELAVRATRVAYLITFACPSPETVQQKKLKKPGEFSRYAILHAVLDAVAKTNAPRSEAWSVGRRQARTTPLLLKFVVVFQERHGDGEIHYHVGVLAEENRCFRFGPIKEILREDYRLESNWSGHGGYSSCVAYGYLPSPKKKLKELDPTPLRWARVGASLSESLRAVCQ